MCPRSGSVHSMVALFVECTDHTVAIVTNIMQPHPTEKGQTTTLRNIYRLNAANDCKVGIKRVSS